MIRFFERVETFLYRRAHSIVAVTNSFKEELMERGVPAEKIHVVTDGVDLERLGALAGGHLDDLARTADRHAPLLHRRDRFGRDHDHIEYHPAYREMERIAFEDFAQIFRFVPDLVIRRQAKRQIVVLIRLGRIVKRTNLVRVQRHLLVNFVRVIFLPQQCSSFSRGKRLASRERGVVL